MQRDELVDLLLQNRGITQEEREDFLHPSYELLYDPFLFRDMEKAVTRIHHAIVKNEHIVIYSDYDADGIPGGVLMRELFVKIGFTNFENYIPHRHDEGYGLHIHTLEEFITRETKVLITVDLGITAVEAVKIANEGGMDVIITDHHLPGSEIPPAYTILNPKREDNTYPDTNLCGAGVAFTLVRAFIKKYGAAFDVVPGWEKWLLDLVGIATLSDMVPLRGENRILATYGLRVLQKNRRPGLQALFTEMKIDVAHLSEDDVTFMLTPRLNAASRMDTPQLAFQVLSEHDPVEAKVLAKALAKINTTRKTTVASIMKEVHARLADRELRDVVVIGDPSWRVGVLGLVASKITEVYNRPSFVWGQHGAEEDNVFKGSCRSEGSVNVVTLMQKIETSLLSFGGHQLAGGFSLTHEQLYTLEETLVSAYHLVKEQERVTTVVASEATLTLADVSKNVYEAVAQLAPFGYDNPKPFFTFPSCTILSVKQFGKTKEHLELVVRDSSGAITKAISFFTTPQKYAVPLDSGNEVSIIGSLEKSHFLGRTEYRLRIIDIQS